MAVLRKSNKQEGFDLHRREMIKLAREVNERTGIVGEPTMTAEQLRESQIARGIRPEENLGSRELMRMRYGDDWDKE